MILSVSSKIKQGKHPYVLQRSARIHIMQEQEIKRIILNRQTFERVLDVLGEPFEVVSQTNLYLDTQDWRLRSLGIMVRVRMANEQLILTVKHSAIQQEGCFNAQELECPLTGFTLDEITARGLSLGVRLAPLEWVAAQDIDPETVLQVRGSTWNIRRRFDRQSLGIWELDHTRFHDHTEDFELEVETEDLEGVRHAVHGLEIEIQQVLPPQTVTKSERMFMRL